MIVSASYRTDIPAFYGDWFNRRMSAGYVVVHNPYGGGPRKISLAPDDVDGFVFWTRNATAFHPTLDRLFVAKVPFVVQYTITGYPRCLDAATLDAEAAVADLLKIACHFGRRSVVWRYDPVIFTSATPPSWHLEAFANLCRELSPAIDEVVVSVAQIYKKSARNLNKAAATFSVSWNDPPPAEKRWLLNGLATVAADRGLRFSICGQPDLVGQGMAEARCIDTDRLCDVAGRKIDADDKSHRPGCRCAKSVDIGAYDTCAQGCAYCYAVSSRAVAKRNLVNHDPSTASLSPRLRESERRKS